MKRIFIFALCSLLFVPAEGAKRKVHTIGDSTMSDYKPAATPKRGWGMYLQAFFYPDSVQVNNRGKSGASTRTFYETENLWPSVKKQMSAGDYLIIQFAHNDEKCKGEDVYAQNAKLRAEGKDTLTDMRGTEPNTTYKEYLRTYIREAREMGVTPILMSPICRAYFKDGKINPEGRHDLSPLPLREGTGVGPKDYVRCMREVALEMGVPFLDMTARSQELYESSGADYCMAHFFNCGDKTHTSAAGGMAIASLAYELIINSPELEEMHAWMHFPTQQAYTAYATNIEESGKKAAFAAKGTPFSETLAVTHLSNLYNKGKNSYLPSLQGEELCSIERPVDAHRISLGGRLSSEGAWPAGEVDEVANRYIEYSIAAEKKKGLVIESITLPVRGQGGPGMNLHINYGFGESFDGVTTIYENTALPKNKWLTVQLDQPILVPAGQTLYIRVLPWYDSNGKPQTKKSLQLKDLKITGKRLQ